MIRWTALPAALLLTAPALAGNTLIAPNARVVVAKSTMTVAPTEEWNKLGARPGRYAESWTLDGDALNELTFYGGVESGRPLFREVSKRDRPLPHMSTTMLLTDIPTFLENSYRIALNTPLFAVDSIEPARFAGQSGVRFTYSFTNPGDDLPRKGEARAAIVGGKLYMITFEAPRLHFFDRSIAAARAVADSAKL